MRTLIGCTLMAVIFIIVNSCCHKRYCEGMNSKSMITLDNFNEIDVDSVVIETFHIDANGTRVRLDSSFMSGQSYGNTAKSIVYLSKSLTPTQEYKITLSSKNMDSVYVLSNFTGVRKSCNNCFPKGLMDDDFMDLYSYEVNGIIQYYNDLRIMN